MKKTLKIYLGLIILYVLLLFLVDLIPNNQIINQVKSSDWVFEQEGVYPEYLFYTPNAQLDNVTDQTMINSALNEEGLNALENAMSVHDYARYWHGYLVFLKPLLLVFSYINIRFICMIAFFMLFLYTFYVIAKELKLAYAFFWAFSICITYVIYISVSLQFLGVFLIMMSSMIIFAKKYKLMKKEVIINTFFVIGSFTNFIDFLTVPLITLGMPLILVTLFDIENSNKPFLEQIKDIVFRSFSWGMGYGLTWITKWIIASIVLKENIILNALNQGLYRIEGNDNHKVVQKDMLYLNITQIITKEIMAFLLVGLIIFIILILLFKRKHSFSKNCFILLIVALYPYIWYIVLTGHSQDHFWFTYREQIITIFSVLCFFYSMLNIEKIREACKKYIKKINVYTK